MEQLGINGPALLAQVVNFALLFLILRAVAYQPVLRILDERAAKARETAELAEEAKRLARHSEEEYAARRAEALHQGQEIVARANEAAERIYREAEERARHVSDQFLAKSREEIGRERELAIAQIRQQMADIAVLAAGKIIHSTLNPADHFRLVEEALAEAERAHQSQKYGGV